MVTTIPNVVVIGGGIVGSCVSLFLARAGVQNITVLDKDLSYESSSTERSASAIRQQFHLAVNVAMSHFGYEFFTELERYLPAGIRHDIGFVERGYLVLATRDARDRLEVAHARQVEVGASVRLLEERDLAAEFRWLKMDDIGAATFGTAGEGWFDPGAALAAVRAGAEARGVRYVQAEVVGVDVDGRSIRGLRTSGGPLQCALVVNAAGADAGRVAAMIETPIPIEGRKRTVFVFRPKVPLGHELPNLVDPTVAGRGMYMRPYQDAFLAVTAPAAERDPDTRELTPDDYLFDEVLRPALARRVRGFEDVDLLSTWGGLYEMNTADQNAIIGAHPAVDGFFFACGFSGHGVMHAPAAGRGIAELITQGRYASIDLSPFSVERIAAGETLDDIQPSETRSRSAGI